MQHNQINLTHFKIKVPPAQTPELTEFYRVLFDELHAGWAGASHYCYGEDAAEYQDGFVYLFKRCGHWCMSCDRMLFGKEEERKLIPELTVAQLSQLLMPKITFFQIG